MSAITILSRSSGIRTRSLNLVCILIVTAIVSGCVGFQNVKAYKSYVSGIEYVVVDKPIVQDDGSIKYVKEIIEVPQYSRYVDKEINGRILGTSGQKIQDSEMAIEKNDTSDKFVGLIENGVALGVNLAKEYAGGAAR